MQFLWIIATVLAVVSVASAEPPSRFRQNYRTARFFQRQELEPTTETAADTTTESVSAESTETPDAAGPYAPSGWKPSGRLLALPARQQSAVPRGTYGPPQTVEVEATTVPEDVEEVPATTEEVEVPKSARLEVEDVEQVDVEQTNAAAPGAVVHGTPPQNVYFVQLPTAVQPQYQPYIYVTSSGQFARLQAAQPASVQQQQQYVFARAQPLVIPNIVAPLNNNNW